MSEYETDPRREPADSAADQPHSTELPRADRGESGSTDAATPTTGGATHATTAGGFAGIPTQPTDSYPPSPWQAPGAAGGGYPGSAPAGHHTGAAPGYPAGTTAGGYPGGGHSGNYASGYPTSSPTSGYPTSGYPASTPTSGYPASGYPASAPTSGYPTSGYPGGQQTGYPGGQQTGYPGGQQAGGSVPPGHPGYGGPQPPWATGHGAPAGPSGPGRVGRAVLFGVVGLVLLAGSSIAGGVVALAFDDDAPAGATRTYTAAPIINSADLPGIAAAVQDSVVSINSGEAEGSGVLLSADGLVLTNNHVVAGAQGGAVQVVFADGKTANAKVVGTDPPTDLAVVQAQDVSGLKPAKFGDSDAMRVGDTVLALGSPLGLQGSVTAGIISARDRSLQSGGEQDGAPQQRGRSSITGLLQTDAPINPGNSGGALVNTKGEVIGINTAILTAGQSNGNIGVGFAIPSNKATSVAEALRRGEKVSHPYLGVSVTTGEESGALVSAVTPGSPADKVGLRQGDVITRFGDKPVAESADLVAAVQAGKVGDKVEVTYKRNGTEERATVTLAETS